MDIAKIIGVIKNKLEEDDIEIKNFYGEISRIHEKIFSIRESKINNYAMLKFFEQNGPQIINLLDRNKK